MMHKEYSTIPFEEKRRMSWIHRGGSGWRCNRNLWSVAVLILIGLAGCGSEQSDLVQPNSAAVNLNITMPQRVSGVSDYRNSLWTTFRRWILPTEAWAQTVGSVSLLVVQVTGPGIPSPVTARQPVNGVTDGQVILITLDVPVGPDRVFTVSGLTSGNETILQGESDPTTLISGQAATVPITLADARQPRPTIVSPASLPISIIGTSYGATMTATGGTPPYQWSVTPPLPAGLDMTLAGAIRGTPQAGTVGTTTHIFSVTDSASPTPQTGTRNYSFTISPPGLAIITPSLPNGTVTQNYPNTQLAASGGIPPYTWTIIGGLPPAPGLSLSPPGAPAGFISGTPSTNEGSPFTRTYQVQDSAIPPRIMTKSLSITVNLPAPPNITTPRLPNGAFRQLYTQTLQVSGGTPPFVWRVTGDLPDGISLNPSTGVLAGMASVTGRFPFTANVTDATGQTDPTPPALSITITSPTPPVITTVSPLPTGTVNQPYPATVLTATGGAPPLAWDPVVIPALPNGLRFDPNTATISGTPLSASQPTTHTFTVRDSTAPSNQTGTKGLQLTINSALTIDTTLPSGTTTQAYSATLIASGGTPPYTWSINQDPRVGPLSPAPGLSLSSSGAITGTPTTVGSFSFRVRATDSSGLSDIQDLSIAVVPDFTGTYVGLEALKSDQRQFQIKIIIAQTGNSATVSIFSQVGGVIPANPQESGQAAVTGGTFTFNFTESINGQPFTSNLWTFNLSDPNTLHFAHHREFLQPGDTRPDLDSEGFLPRQGTEIN